MTPERTRETLELVTAISAGASDGERTSTRDERQIVKPPAQAGGKPQIVEPAKAEERCDPAAIAAKALKALEPGLAEWKRPYAAERMPAADLLAAMGSTPGMLAPAVAAGLPLPADPSALDRVADRLAGRPCWALPAYFEPHLIEIAAHAIIDALAGGAP